MTKRLPFEPNDELVQTISREVQGGKICYLHRPTGDVNFLPDDDEFFDNLPSEWSEFLDFVEANEDDFAIVEPMDEFDHHQVMTDFMVDVTLPVSFTALLYDALQGKQPRSAFTQEVNNSPYRKQWTDYHQQRYEEYVRTGLVDYDWEEE